MNIEVSNALDGNVTRLRAYYLWEAAGRPLGRADEFWHAAVAEMSAEQRPQDKSVIAAKRDERPKSDGSWEVDSGPMALSRVP